MEYCWRCSQKSAPMGTRILEMAKRSFKEVTPLERRRAINASAAEEEYPDGLPVILQNARRSLLPDIDEKVYLIPEDWTVGQFVNLIRSKVTLCQEQAAGKAIYLYVKNMLLPPAAFMSTVYDQHRHVDGFLYMAYSDKRSLGFQ